ncbi:glycosyltransferase family 4 protein [Paraburkholderia unamae]|uniref:Glycosyltransferase involved in cell wall biosynthesis n=1 Tax=Paraburkholderia unamae TaxID=219649 RepID=A0ABX5KEJ0_9BURK|nr:glycosyltransferase family 4 protein [Paraburkholderia unamae]PVX73214.1 glycosyltransferase involved in cell wall biosynthesis [Paraburkholderia unamae]
MKIGVSCNVMQHSGGMERYARDLARGIAERGFRPAYFARRLDPTLPEHAMIDPHRINVSFLPGKLRDAWFSWRLRHARRAAAVDVMVGCNRVDSSDIAVCGGTHRGFLRACGRKPTLFDRWQIALEERQYANAAIILAHSPLMRDELIELYGIHEAKVRILRPPVDTARFTPVDAPARAALRKRLGFQDHECVLLFPSSSHVRKGLALVEAALRDLDEPVVVAVVGRPVGAVSPRVRYIGFQREIEDCYRAADFTILASAYEPFGLVGIESVMCGTPVIIPSTMGCADVIARHAKYVFERRGVLSLRAAIRRAVASRCAATTKREKAVLYDASVAAHIDSLLALANLVHSG